MIINPSRATDIQFTKKSKDIKLLKFTIANCISSHIRCFRQLVRRHCLVSIPSTGGHNEEFQIVSTFNYININNQTIKKYM